MDRDIILKDPQRSVINGFACHLDLSGLTKIRERSKLNLFAEITGAFKLEAFLKNSNRYQCPPIPAIPTRAAVTDALQITSGLIHKNRYIQRVLCSYQIPGTLSLDEDDLVIAILVNQTTSYS